MSCQNADVAAEMLLSDEFGAPPPRPRCEGDEVHVWAVKLEAETQHGAGLGEAEGAGLLADDERARAERFRFALHRRRFIASRIALRRILALYTDSEPQNLVFSYGPLGKPDLEKPDLEGRLLHFNLSHSEDLALVAVTGAGPVGVDVERLRSFSRRRRLARRVLSRAERERLQELPEGERSLAFARAWTRKEAVVKARGEGVYEGLERIEVSLGPGEPPRVLALSGSEREPERWTLHELRPAPGFVGTVAVKGRGARLRRWCWSR